MMKIKKYFLDNVILLIIIGILVFSNLFYYASFKAKEHEIFYQYKTIPNISLGYTLEGAGNYYSGEIRGFVKFIKKENQPKGARQYYIIKPYKDAEFKTTHFILETIYSLSSISPQSTGFEYLEIIENNLSMLTLSDSYGNKYLINKISKEIKIIDVDGDTVELITSDYDYRKFVIDNKNNI